MSSISELRLIKGVDDTTYQLLQPLLVALPKTSSYNVNTLKSGLLEAVGINMPAEAFSARQSTGGWQSLADAKHQLGSRLVDTSLLATQSDYFEILVVAEFNGRFAKLRTLVHRARPDGTITVLSRVMDPTLLFEDERYNGRNTGS
jgi:type II secretory pathway component PulK